MATASPNSAPVVDSHAHVVSLDERLYPLSPSGIGGRWFRETPVPLEVLAGLMAEAGVERAVLVQAVGPYGYDNSYILDAARTDPARFTAVCALDPRSATAPGESLRRLVGEGGLLGGVRMFAIGPGLRPDDAWFDDALASPVWEAAGELGLAVVMTVLPSQLDEVGRMAGRFPEVAVALDHCGFVDFRSGPPYPAARRLLDLAPFGNVHLKVTSHVLEGAAGGAEGAGALVERLCEAFGPSRLLWGSDFSQTHNGPYADLVALGRRACTGLAHDDRPLFLKENAMRLWPPLATTATEERTCPS